MKVSSLLLCPGLLFAIVYTEHVLLCHFCQIKTTTFFFEPIDQVMCAQMCVSQQNLKTRSTLYRKQEAVLKATAVRSPLRHQ